MGTLACAVNPLESQKKPVLHNDFTSKYILLQPGYAGPDSWKTRLSRPHGRQNNNSRAFPGVMQPARKPCWARQWVWEASLHACRCSTGCLSSDHVCEYDLDSFPPCHK